MIRRRFRRSVLHDLPLEEARRRAAAAALRLGFAGEGEALRRGTVWGELQGADPKQLRAWLRIDAREGEVGFELSVSQTLTILYPQDARFYEAELDALEVAVARGEDLTPTLEELQREAQRFSHVMAALVLATIAGVIATAAGARWF